MFYISEEDAVKFWQYLKGETDRLQQQTDKLDDKLKDRLAEWQTPDSFCLEWQAEVNAARIAIRNLRADIELSNSTAIGYTGQPMNVSQIDRTLQDAMKRNNYSTFQAASLIESRASDIFAATVAAVLSFSFKTTEAVAA